MKIESYRLNAWMAVIGISMLVACGSDSSGTDTGPTDAGIDVPGDPGSDPGMDLPADPGTDTPEDATAQDVPDAEPDGGCLPQDATRCSEDGYTLFVCKDGVWMPTECMRDNGQLCQDGQCVDPWRYDSPEWPTCPNEPLATPETLAAKAAYFDDIARRLHVHPDLKWAMGVTLKKVEVDCPVDVTPPCHAPIRPESEATWQDVERWWTGENDGLWSGLYFTSQAFRYGATRDPEALQNIKLLLEGEVTRMRITGVPGIFTRQFVPPGVPGIACPADERHYVTDVEKDDNQWVQIRDDGCVWVIPHETWDSEEQIGVWTKTDHCGLDDYKGWCWLDNVSQDEYAGHMLVLGVLWKLVDDPDVRATVTDLMTQVALHLMENDLYFIDWDGRKTEHGRLHVHSLADTPGFLAALSMDYILQGAVSSDRQDIRRYYDECLLRRGEACPDWPYDTEGPYQDHLEQMLLYLGADGCKSNYNNFSMVLCALHNLAWFEQDPEIREIVQRVFDQNFMREAGQTRPLIDQRNPWYNFTWAAFKRLGPGSDGPALDAVNDGICSLKQFAASKQRRTADSLSKYPHYCDTRLNGSATEFVIPLPDRCVATFEWWGDPYRRRSCTGSEYEIAQPGDYLLPYWMGRYFGFISEDL